MLGFRKVRMRGKSVPIARYHWVGLIMKEWEESIFFTFSDFGENY